MVVHVRSPRRAARGVARREPRGAWIVQNSKGFEQKKARIQEFQKHTQNIMEAFPCLTTKRQVTQLALAEFKGLWSQLGTYSLRKRAVLEKRRARS